MRPIPRARSDPDPGGGRAGRAMLAFLLLLMISAGAPTSPAAGTPGAASPSPEDTLGTAWTQWAHDSWSVPWARVRGASALLAPASNVTFRVLACATTDLERDRLARHLSTEPCEHGMPEIRADRDTLRRAEAAATPVHGGRTHHFCVPECRERFAADPERFMAALRRPTGRL